MAAIRMHIYWQSRLVESEGLFAERKLERERERAASRSLSSRELSGLLTTKRYLIIGQVR